LKLEPNQMMPMGSVPVFCPACVRNRRGEEVLAFLRLPGPKYPSVLRSADGGMDKPWPGNPLNPDADAAIELTCAECGYVSNATSARALGSRQGQGKPLLVL